jgi:hypothetical protein
VLWECYVSLSAPLAHHADTKKDLVSRKCFGSVMDVMECYGVLWKCLGSVTEVLRECYGVLWSVMEVL